MKSINQFKDIAAMVAENVVSVNCRFSGTATLYTFKCTKELAATLKKDDLVVAETHNGNKYVLVTVADINDICDLNTNGDIKYCWLFQKVDTQLLDGIKEEEKAIAERLFAALERMQITGTVPEKPLPEDATEQHKFDDVAKYYKAPTKRYEKKMVDDGLSSHVVADMSDDDVVSHVLAEALDAEDIKAENK